MVLCGVGLEAVDKFAILVNTCQQSVRRLLVVEDQRIGLCEGSILRNDGDAGSIAVCYMYGLCRLSSHSQYGWSLLAQWHSDTVVVLLRMEVRHSLSIEVYGLQLGIGGQSAGEHHVDGVVACVSILREHRDNGFPSDLCAIDGVWQLLSRDLLVKVTFVPCDIRHDGVWW